MKILFPINKFIVLYLILFILVFITTLTTEICLKKALWTSSLKSPLFLIVQPLFFRDKLQIVLIHVKSVGIFFTSVSFSIFPLFRPGERPEAMQTNAAPAAVALACWSCQAVRVISTMVAALVLLEACSSLLLSGCIRGGPRGCGARKRQEDRLRPSILADSKDPEPSSVVGVNNGSRIAR